METIFLTIFTLSLLLFQRYGESSSNTMITISSNVTCIERERESLLVFRHGLINVSNRLSTWAGVECCEWEGVGCDRRNGHVVKLDLRSPFSFMDDDTLNRDNLLRGKVSHSLLKLKHLRYLDLSMNNFLGQNIPEFLGSLKCLEYLNLSNSGFGGAVPHHLGNLSRLQYLDLHRNYGLMVKDDMRWVSSLSLLKHLDFSEITIGNHIDWFHPVNMLPSLLTLNLVSCDINYIPSIKFINFTSLNSLDLSYNGINSTIPVWLSNLTGLVHLDLHYNSFHGQIPGFLGTLSSLSSIDLSSNQFNTSMPDLFWNLSGLVSLDLSLNAFHGWVPADVKLCNLSVLNLSGNEFAGELSSLIGNMSSDCLHNSLKNLYLEQNKFNGRIPNKIGGFKKLESLFLSGNRLSGPIPPSLGGLSSLREMDLSANQLSGNIPESIGQLSLLEILYLENNQLSGNIPTGLGQLSNLKELNVYNNSLVGVVSEIHFTKLNNLTELDLSYNSLSLNVSPHWIPPFQLKYFLGSSCNIGPQFPHWLQTQTDLVWLGLSNTSIRDRMPEWFDNISSHIGELDLSHNQMGGNLPRFHGYNSSNNLNFGRRLRLNSNRFEGSFTSFPSDVEELDLSDNLLSGNLPYTHPTTMNPGPQIVNLGINRFTGSIPAYLCELHSIQILVLSHNKFSGILPKCLGSLIQLRVMDLTNNTITGDIPNSLGSLTYLESLHLHNNKFEGNLPVSLQKLKNLVTMDLGNNLLTGNIPYWIGKKLSKLKILNLQSNMFMGKIPLELCQIKNLQHLNLANNSINGNVPHCFGKLTGMIKSGVKFDYDGYGGYEENIEAYIKGIQLKYTSTIRFLISLDLSSNKIIGEIPDVLMNLVALMNLNLSRNLLSGHIPARIENLRSMESLDLSANKLSGRIPPSLASLNFLSYLNLSFNKLSGPIPDGNQLQTLGDLSTIYEGNTKLCGPTLPRSCKENNLSYVHAGEDEGKDGSQGFSWFYASMVPGFVVGFMGLFGSLHFIKIWRVTYFETMENVFAFLMVSIIVTLARLKRKFF